MKPVLKYTLIAVFSVFIGSQITEGVILVPYWQSLPRNDFYDYYKNFGNLISNFYTILTIIAALIPLFTVIYCKQTKSKGLKFALISSLFAILFVSSFYLYFKDTNDFFFKSAFNDVELKNELIIWSYWHWGRVFIEFVSLSFLILAFNKIQTEKNK